MVTHVLPKHQYVMFGSLGKQGTLCSMSKCKMDKPRIVSWACNEVWQFKMVENKVKMAWLGPRTDPGGARAPGPIFFYLLYFSFFFSCVSLFPISLVSLTQLAIIQHKNLIKTIKAFTMVILF